VGQATSEPGKRQKQPSLRLVKLKNNSTFFFLDKKEAKNQG